MLFAFSSSKKIVSEPFLIVYHHPKQFFVLPDAEMPVERGVHHSDFWSFTSIVISEPNCQFLLLLGVCYMRSYARSCKKDSVFIDVRRGTGEYLAHVYPSRTRISHFAHDLRTDLL